MHTTLLASLRMVLQSDGTLNSHDTSQTCQKIGWRSVSSLAFHQCGHSGVTAPIVRVRIPVVAICENGFRSMPSLAGFLRVVRFPPASKIGSLPIILSSFHPGLSGDTPCRVVNQLLGIPLSSCL